MCMRKRNKSNAANMQLIEIEKRWCWRVSTAMQAYVIMADAPSFLAPGGRGRVGIYKKKAVVFV